MKPLHVICVSTYSSVAEAYKCALKGISGSQKNKHVKMFVPPSCPTTTVCSIDGSLSVSSRRGGADVYIRPLAVIVCVCVTVCVSSDVVVITVGCFFFLKDSLQICLELAFLLQAWLWERILIRLWFQFTSTHQLSPLSIIWFLPPTCCQCSLKHYTSCLYLFHFCKTCILL